jgi:hypothetical protein
MRKHGHVIYQRFPGLLCQTVINEQSLYFIILSLQHILKKKRGMREIQRTRVYTIDTFSARAPSPMTVTGAEAVPRSVKTFPLL